MGCKLHLGSFDDGDLADLLEKWMAEVKNNVPKISWDRLQEYFFRQKGGEKS